MIQITLRQIKDASPCTDGWKKVLEANGGTNADFDKPFLVSSILDSNDLDDTLWVLRCLPEYDTLWRKFACWCALENIELIKPYTDNYDLIADYLKNPTTTAAADAAAYAARAAARADAARAAAAAADAAAADAARAAAAYAARADAARAAAADAYAEQVAKLRQILDAGEWVE